RDPQRWADEGRKAPERWAITAHVLKTAPRMDAPVYVREAAEWAGPAPRDRGPDARFEYLMLARDPRPGKEVTGDLLDRASRGLAGRGNRPITLGSDAGGAARFGERPAENRGCPLAILLDGKISTAPRLNEPIRKHGQITGDFTPQEVRDMVQL